MAARGRENQKSVKVITIFESLRVSKLANDPVQLVGRRLF